MILCRFSYVHPSVSLSFYIYFCTFFCLFSFENKAGFENNQQLACLIKKRLGVRTIYDISLFKTRLREGVSTRETKYISVTIWFLKQNKIHKREKTKTGS